MTVPEFREYEAAPGCPCPGCTRARADSTDGTHRPAAPQPCPGAPARARRALVVAAAAGSVLGTALPQAVAVQSTTAVAPAAPLRDEASDEGLSAAGGSSPDADHGPRTAGVSSAGVTDDGRGRAPGGTPQGVPGGLHGAPVGAAPARTSRQEIVARAKEWVAERVPYSLTSFWSDGYRQDCSGFVSMAWGLGTNQWTGSLASFGTRIPREELQPGDMLLFHNAADPEDGSHVTLFGGWRDAAHTSYLAYEQTRPHTLARETPYPYWSHADGYVAYRYKGLNTAGGTAGPAYEAFPGAAAFAAGTSHPAVARLGELLSARGGARFYPTGTGPRWTDDDREAVAAFQRAQGWKGEEADGMPGPDTWEYLVTGQGRDIPAERAPGAREGAEAAGGTVAEPPAGSREPRVRGKAPLFPGREHFTTGRSSVHVARLARQLVKKGYGEFYPQGPGPRWTVSDRRAVAAFQRAQGWRGSHADGLPGPETWQRLFH